MSKNLKKLISVFAAIMMLVSVIVPAGILPTAAETESAEEVVTAPSAIPVTEYKLNNKTTATGKTYLNEAQYNYTKGSYLIMSFDYIIVNRSTGYNAMPTNVFIFDETGSRGTYAVSEVGSTTTKGDVKLTGYGISHFEEIYYAGKSGSVFRVYGSSDTANNLYMWNFSLKYADTGVEIKPTGDYLSDNVSTETTLADYSWYTDKYYIDNDPMVTTIDFSELNPAFTSTATQYRWYLGDVGKTKVKEFSSSASIWLGDTDSDGYDDDLWEITFDYYLPTVASSQTFVLEELGKKIDEVSNSGMSKGRNTFSYSFRIMTDKSATPTIRTKVQTGMLYVWNLKITVNGYEVTPDMTYINTYSSVVDTGEKVPLSSYEEVWARPADSTVVNKINFSKYDTSSYSGSSSYTVLTNSYYGVFCYGDNYSVLNASGTTTFTLSFDYYLTDDANIGLYFGHAGLFPRDAATGETILQKGRNSFSYSYDATSNTRWAFVVHKNANTPNVTLPDLYIWNLKVVDTTTVTTPTSVAVNGSCLMRQQTNPETEAVYTAAEVMEVGTMADYKDVIYADEEETVNVIDFTACEQQEKTTDNQYTAYLATFYGNYGRQTSSSTYTLTFDYYLPEKDALVYVSYGGSSLVNKYPGSEPVNSSFLLHGRHKFKATGLTLGGYTIPSLSIYSRVYATQTKFYIWNVSFIREDGTQGNNAHFSANITKGSSDGVTTGKVGVAPLTLADAEGVDNLGAQIRDGETADLRFVGAAEVDGVVYNHAAAADYSNATIVIDNVRYNVSEVGMVFARDAKLTDLPENALVVGGENVSQQVATKIQSPEYAAAMGVDGIVFTTVFTDIKTKNQDDTISLRSYVKYVDATGNDAYWYGEVISRGYMQYAG